MQCSLAIFRLVFFQGPAHKYAYERLPQSNVKDIAVMAVKRQRQPSAPPEMKEKKRIVEECCLPEFEALTKRLQLEYGYVCVDLVTTQLALSQILLGSFKSLLCHQRKLYFYFHYNLAERPR